MIEQSGDRARSIAAPLVARLSRVHVNHKKIVASALLIGALTLVAKLFVAGREMAIAWRYGVSSTVDAYQLALTIVTWVPMMVTSVVTVVLVPRLVTIQSDSSERGLLIREINGTLVATGIALAVLTWLVAPGASLLFASNANAGTRDLAVTLCRAMSTAALFVTCSGYLSARLQARQHFSYTVTEALPALVIAAAVLTPFAASPEIRLGVATATGYLVQVVILWLMVWKLEGGLGGVAFGRHALEWPSLYRDLGVMILGQLVITLALPVDQAFAARIGTGAVATLGYASRIVILMTGLGAVVFTRAFLPIFSSAIAEGNFETGARQARQWAFLLMILGFAAVLATWILADWVVAIVFERGAFSSTDAARVAHVLRFGVIQVPFVFAGLALVQWIAARGLYSALLWISCGAIALKLVLNALLVSKFGLAGLMCATAAMNAFSFMCLYFVGLKK